MLDPGREQSVVTPGRDEAAPAIPDVVREVLEAGRFGVQYEPVIEVSSITPCAFEALARFHTPDGAALDSGRVFDHLHGDLTLFSHVELALKRLQLERAPCRKLFVNVDPDGYAAASASGLPLRDLLATRRDLIVVELIENLGHGHAGRIRTMIREMELAGLPVALDDLCAPNALISLESLLRVQYMKLDRSTLRALTDLRHRALVEALVALARRLGVRTVLEGVETREDFAFAELLGIDLVQGHLFRGDYVRVPPGA